MAMNRTPARWVPDRGEMIWLNFTPQAGNEMMGRHPFLVLSPKAFNDKMGAVMGLAMTSKAHPYNPFQLPNPNAKGELSFINTNQVSTFDWRARGAAPHPWGKVSPTSLAQALEYLNSVLMLA
jgi:mRNA interferase MazF